MIPTRMMIMRPGFATVIQMVELEAKPDYDELMSIVEPHLGHPKHVEHVSVLARINETEEERRLDMFVDEDFHEKGLPRNEEATAIYRNATMKGQTGMKPPADPETLPPILGPAVLFSRRVWF